MPTTILRRVVAGALLGAVWLGSAPAWAQLTVEPQSLDVAVAQYETATRTLTLTNAGSEPLGFCLNFERPLQRTGSVARLSADALGEACGPYGEVLALIPADDVPGYWDPYGATMTPDGRLFVADYRRSVSRTHELTSALELVRSFPHPRVEELVNRAKTTGVAYNADTGTLWWLNIESLSGTVYRALLLEGDLDGVETGRRIELPVADSGPPPHHDTGFPLGLAYDPAMQHYFFTDIADETIWAVDTLGSVVEGYPVQMEAYPGATIARGLSVLPAAEPEGLRIELYINPPGPTPPRHIGVVGRYGEDTAPGGAEPLETPYASDNPNTPPGAVNGVAVRGVLDPNGVLYYPWGGFDMAGVVAIRPHPLPPSWLVVEAWRGALAPGESRGLWLAFRPGAREVGEYTSVLQVFEAATGEAVEVPLTMSVTPGVDNEEEAAPEEASRLEVYPNPSAGTATVAITLAEASEVRVVVYDVLGRVVALLHDGPLGMGEHAISFESAHLPAGIYIARAESGGFSAARRVTLVR